MVWRYAEPDFPKLTYLSNIIGYFISFGIILVVPIDMATVIMDRRGDAVGSSPTYEANIKSMSEAYNFFFGMIIGFSGFYLVFEEYYNTDGNFTVLSKMWNSFKIMMRDTILLVLIGAIILYVLIQQKVVPGDTAALTLTAVILTNTIYESFLMFLLGYGLVEFPRMFWRASYLENRLKLVQTKAASDFKDIQDAHFEIAMQVANAKKTSQELDMKHAGNEELRKAMEIILSECPAEFRSSRAGTAATDKNGDITIPTLAYLRTNLKFYKSRYRMAVSKVELTKLEAYSLEDLIDAKRRNTEDDSKYDGLKVVHWSLSGKTSTEFEYHWQLDYRPKVLKVVSVCMALMSIFSFIGVVSSMGGIDPKNSIYFIAVEDPRATTGGIVIFIFFTLGYTVYVTLWSLFQIKFAGLMDLVPGQTTPESLSFNVRMVARLAAPLAFFYLGWLSENGITSGDWTYNNAPPLTVDGKQVSQAIYMPTAFSRFYQLASVDFIKNTFGIIFPVVLISFTFLTVTNFYNWVMTKLGFYNLQFGTPLVTEEQMREGIRQLAKTRKSTLAKARRMRFRSFLMRLAHGDTQELHEQDGDNEALEAGASKGFLSSIFGCPSKPAAAAEASANQRERGFSSVSHDDLEKNKLELPEGCSGNVGVKVGSNIMKDIWDDTLFARVRAPGILNFYASGADALHDIEIKKYNSLRDGIDLKFLADIKISGGKTLILSLNNDSYSLRFPESSTTDEWKRKLLAWKDFSVDHGFEYLMQGVVPASDEDSLENLRMSDIEVNDASLSPEDHLVDPEAPSDTPSKYEGDLGDEKPKPLSGYVEEKMKSMIGENWKQRFLVVDENSGHLLVKNSAAASETPVERVNLAACLGISFYNNKGKEKTRFNVKTGEKERELKFRVSSEADGRRFVDGLNEWKDYFLMNYQG